MGHAYMYTLHSVRHIIWCLVYGVNFPCRFENFDSSKSFHTEDYKIKIKKLLMAKS